jgi:hypothetical protein
VAVADDEEAIFYNPAGLAGIQKMQFTYLGIDLGVSSDVITSATTATSAFSDLSADTVNQFMGKDLYVKGTVAPTLVAPNFGFALLMDGEAALLAKNQALPRITLGYQTTNGVQVAYGVTIGGARHRRGSRGELRVGIAGKLLWRRGGYHTMSLMEVMNLGTSSFRDMAGNFGRAIGADLGTQYVFRANSRLTLAGGLVYTDIGDTTFGEHADALKGNLSAGVAATYELRGAKLILAADQRHITDETDWRKKMHVGVTAKLPLLELHGGVSQASLTYGATVDLWLFRLTGLSYVEELGSFAFQDPMRRWVLRMALKLDL